MQFIKTDIRESLNKGYLKQSILRLDIDRFKKNLVMLYDRLKVSEHESEEHHKNIISDFLKETYYRNQFEINTYERTDLVIHHGKSTADSVGVIIETKLPKNKSEMVSFHRPNTKALHELLRYYLRERYTNNNKNIKHLIATNIYEWYVFDGSEFERFFFENPKLIKKYTEWNSGSYGAHSTEWFYQEIAKPFIEEHLESIKCCYFNLRVYEVYARNNDNTDDEKLIDLYKILSPEHLLKKPFANDSNTLNKDFYNELLHILGLTEIKEESKKLIKRKENGNRDEGSLIENTINILLNKNSQSMLKLNQEGKPIPEDELFNIALELCIVWLNRILFLKLLEGQIIKYNRNLRLAFLNSSVIFDFDELHELFFEVLAVPLENRINSVKNKYKDVPYLNSSLFEPSDIERTTMTINELKDRFKIPVFDSTVLKDDNGKRITGQRSTLYYLFDFLNAYDFSSDSSSIIQEQNKTIINAAVLGLIFEKINGYKEGSYFTPGFVTMFMCRETIRMAVVQNFNEAKGWDCKDFNELAERIDYLNENERNEANTIVNSIKICDPAVGSGHFLVSALNEVIAIKSDLKILNYIDGKRIRGYKIYVENDELIILNEETNALFEYHLNEHGRPISDLQKLQESLFQEKQTIIENCLFGVDINPKSVIICRLRLWIELLKNAYYIDDGKSDMLETLPNIDINIKTGNSLISRFDLADNMKVKDLVHLEAYKNLVFLYKNEKDRSEKLYYKKSIEENKEKFEGFLVHPGPEELRLIELQGELHNIETQLQAFISETEIEKINNRKEKIVKEIEKINKSLDDKKKFFENLNRFEWRFEFPEVLNENGDFIGFDVVIGNPPYIQLQSMGKDADILQNRNYMTYVRTGDIYSLFIEKGFELLKKKGLLTMITSNKWMRAAYGDLTRKFLANNTKPLQLIDFAGFKVFDSATVDTNILIVTNDKSNKNQFFGCSIDTNFNTDTKIDAYFNEHKISMPIMGKDIWTISSDLELQIKRKIESVGTPLKNWEVNIYRGILTGFNEAFIIDGKKKDELIENDPKSAELIKPILRGRDIKRYNADFADLWVIYIPKGFTIKTLREKRANIVSEPIPRYGYEEYNEAWEFIKSEYPAIARHLIKYKAKAEKRQDQGDYWWEMRACAYLDSFNREKVVWKRIGSVIRFQYDNIGSFCLDSTCFLVGGSVKYLLAVSNSKVFLHQLFESAPKTGTGDLLISVQAIEPIFVPKIDSTEQKPIISLVNKILTNKESGISCSREESIIDILVFKLYELASGEVKIIDKEFDNVLSQFNLTTKVFDTTGYEELVKLITNME